MQPWGNVSGWSIMIMGLSSAAGVVRKVKAVTETQITVTQIIIANKPKTSFLWLILPEIKLRHQFPITF
jgi:hypothetical protein